MNYLYQCGRMVALLLGAALLSACGGSDDDGAEAAAVSDASLRFTAAVNNAPFDCGQTYSGVGTGVNSEFQINDLRLFIHDARLLRPDGSGAPLALEQDGVWQLDTTALLDFETGCGSGTPETNTVVVAKVDGELSEYSGVCFKLGLPFEQNHITDATNLSPLNASGMLWSWTGGRKFVRIDGRGDPTNLNVAYNVHLGSTGCVDSAGDPAPDSACAFPNVAEICLQDFDAANDRILVDVGHLLADKDITVSSGPPGCMSGNTDLDCIGLMNNFGLDFTYNDGVNPPEVHQSFDQALFRKQ